MLENLDSDDDNDYINASYIPVSENTVSDMCSHFLNCKKVTLAAVGNKTVRRGTLPLPKKNKQTNNTTQHNTTQHNTTQHNTTQNNTQMAFCPKQKYFAPGSEKTIRGTWKGKNENWKIEKKLELLLLLLLLFLTLLSFIQSAFTSYMKHTLIVHWVVDLLLVPCTAASFTLTMLMYIVINCN